VLSAEEEERLLAACVEPRSHLKALVVCAPDSAMRKGETLQLRRSFVNLLQGVLNLPSEIPKSTTEPSPLAHTGWNEAANFSRDGNIFVCALPRDACVQLRTGAKMRATGGFGRQSGRRRAEETKPDRYTPRRASLGNETPGFRFYGTKFLSFEYLDALNC